MSYTTLVETWKASRGTVFARSTFQLPTSDASRLAWTKLESRTLARTLCFQRRSELRTLAPSPGSLAALCTSSDSQNPGKRAHESTREYSAMEY